MQKTETREIIRVRAKYGTAPTLAKTFNVSTVTVSNALSGKSNSKKAKKIRKAAVELGADPIYSNN